MINLLFSNIINNCDTPKPWGLYFQDSATPQMEGLVELHDNIMFYLVIVLFGVGWIMITREVVNKKSLQPFKDHDPLMPGIKSTFTKKSTSPTPKESADVIFRPILKTKPNAVFNGKCDRNKWLELDTSNTEYLRRRLEILKKNKKNVIGFKPDADLACRELFHYVFTYIYAKYPDEYYLYRHNNIYFIICYTTNYHYYIGDLATHDPIDFLTILSECVVVDFSLLKKVDGKYLIIASNSLFSINWQVSDRLGFDIVKLHGTAPGWQEGGEHYIKYVQYLDTIHSGVIHKRSNIFIINTPTLFLAEHYPKVPLSSEIGIAVGYRLKDLYLRREVQTFHLLPVSGLIVFGVRTYMQSLDSLSYNEILDIQTLVNSWVDDVAKYHGRDTWLPVIDKHIKEIKNV